MAMLEIDCLPLFSRKNCIAVGGKYPHVRRYKRDVKNGVNELHAHFEVTYLKLKAISGITACMKGAK